MTYGMGAVAYLGASVLFILGLGGLRGCEKSAATDMSLV